MNLEYTETIKPRVSDINYGGHVGHVELMNLMHEIRVRFLKKYSLKETDIDGHVLVMRSINTTYFNQAFWDDELKITMKTKVDGVKIIFNYLIFNSTLDNKTAEAEAVMVLLDEKQEKPVRPNEFIRILSDDNNAGKHT